MCITNTSIVGADSLLGVKYILSKYDIQGLEKIQEMNEGEKAVYRNPYALPMAFTYDDDVTTDGETEKSENPFEYQNDLYKELFHVSENIYKPLQYSVSADESTNSIKIQLYIPENADNPVYGVIPWNSWMGAGIYVDGQYITDYACWLSPSVFYVPKNNRSVAEIEVQANSLDFNMDAIQFYMLDLKALKECSQFANESKVENILIENGVIKGKVEGKKGDRLLISVPEDDGWEITVNGKHADVKLIGNCLYSIELSKGSNEFEMKYHVAYLKTGVIVSIVTVMILMMLIFLDRRKNNWKRRNRK